MQVDVSQQLSDNFYYAFEKVGNLIVSCERTDESYMASCEVIENGWEALPEQEKIYWRAMATYYEEWTLGQIPKKGEIKKRKRGGNRNDCGAKKMLCLLVLLSDDRPIADRTKSKKRRLLKPPKGGGSEALQLLVSINDERNPPEELEARRIWSRMQIAATDTAASKIDSSSSSGYYGKWALSGSWNLVKKASGAFGRGVSSAPDTAAAAIGGTLGVLFNTVEYVGWLQSKTSVAGSEAYTKWQLERMGRMDWQQQQKLDLENKLAEAGMRTYRQENEIMDKLNKNLMNSNNEFARLMENRDIQRSLSNVKQAKSQDDVLNVLKREKDNINALTKFTEDIFEQRNSIKAAEESLASAKLTQSEKQHDNMWFTNAKNRLQNFLGWTNKKVKESKDVAKDAKKVPIIERNNKIISIAHILETAAEKLENEIQASTVPYVPVGKFSQDLKSSPAPTMDVDETPPSSPSTTIKADEQTPPPSAPPSVPQSPKKANGGEHYRYKYLKYKSKYLSLR